MHKQEVQRGKKSGTANIQGRFLDVIIQALHFCVELLQKISKIILRLVVKFICVAANCRAVSGPTHTEMKLIKCGFQLQDYNIN